METWRPIVGFEGLYVGLTPFGEGFTYVFDEPQRQVTKSQGLSVQPEANECDQTEAGASGTTRII